MSLNKQLNMSPLTLFDFIYYIIAHVYSKIFHFDYQKRFAGVGLLSMVQLCNFIFVYNRIDLEQLVSIDITWIYICTYTLLLIFNIFRYYKFVSFKKLEDKWRKANKYKRFIRIFLITFYVIVSFYLVGI
jgi:hypothetical protein